MTLLTLAGPKTARLNLPDDTLTAWSARFPGCHIDLGTGDGRFARELARQSPAMAVIGLDTCLDHLKGSPRRLPTNLRYITADALTFATGLLPAAQSVSINFPYGSLLKGLIEGDDDLLLRLDCLLAGESELIVRVNASAIVAAGHDPLVAERAITTSLTSVPHTRMLARSLSQEDLRRFPSSWAKRLGHGRTAKAFCIVLNRA